MAEEEETPLQRALCRIFESGQDVREEPELWKAILHVCWQADYYHQKVPMLEGRMLKEAVEQLEREAITHSDMMV